MRKTADDIPWYWQEGSAYAKGAVPRNAEAKRALTPAEGAVLLVHECDELAQQNSELKSQLQAAEEALKALRLKI